MNQDELKSTSDRLLEVNGIIKDLDPAIKEKSFDLLKQYVTGTPPDGNDGEDAAADDMDTFFSKFDHDKPSDNVFLIASYLYSTYGDSPFSVKEVQEIADEVGITLPDRPDVTLNAAQKKGKSLFNRTGKGMYKPTVHGATSFKEKYGVKKGKLRKEGTE